MVTSLLSCREQKVLDRLRRLIMKWILLIVASIWLNCNVSTPWQKSLPYRPVPFGIGKTGAGSN